ncbi:MAG: hypothetical protein QGH15_22420, partial [Kiritimatiellia bacterium]|nr:hypothetical protein [Kiritimatiellia bacterium]
MTVKASGRFQKQVPHYRRRIQADEEGDSGQMTKLHDGEKILKSEMEILYGNPSLKFADEAGRAPDL